VSNAKPTVKGDVLENARGSFLGAPVSVTRDDDPKQTRRFTPAELDSLIGQTKRSVRAYYVGVGILCAFTVGATAGAFSTHRDERVPTLPPPVRPTTATRTLVARDLPSAAPTSSARPRLLRKRPTVDVKQPLFSPYESM
jgi:hypothetical protein